MMVMLVAHSCACLPRGVLLFFVFLGLGHPSNAISNEMDSPIMGLEVNAHGQVSLDAHSLLAGVHVHGAPKKMARSALMRVEPLPTERYQSAETGSELSSKARDAEDQDHLILPVGDNGVRIGGLHEDDDDAESDRRSMAKSAPVPVPTDHESDTDTTTNSVSESVPDTEEGNYSDNATTNSSADSLNSSNGSNIINSTSSNISNESSISINGSNSSNITPSTETGGRKKGSPFHWPFIVLLIFVALAAGLGLYAYYSSQRKALASAEDWHEAVEGEGEWADHGEEAMEGEEHHEHEEEQAHA